MIENFLIIAIVSLILGAFFFIADFYEHTHPKLHISLIAGISLAYFFLVLLPEVAIGIPVIPFEIVISFLIVTLSPITAPLILTLSPIMQFVPMIVSVISFLSPIMVFSQIMLSSILLPLPILTLGCIERARCFFI